MRILFTIPHFYGLPEDTSVSKNIGSTRSDPRARIDALTGCIRSIHQLFHSTQRMIHADTRRTSTSNSNLVADQVDVVLVTTGHSHLTNALPISSSEIEHRSTDVEPEMLGFECHAIQRERLGQYDFYCYMEDDLILHDPWLFQKLTWFNQHLGSHNLLMPNRFEFGSSALIYKAYVDGNLDSRVTEPFQDIGKQPRLRASVMGTEVVFSRTLNPHSGCYFLNHTQMSKWAEQSHFLDHDTSFIGPLESAATLGIMRTFAVYKPAAQNASFLEVEHFGDGFLRQLRRDPNAEPTSASDDTSNQDSVGQTPTEPCGA